VTALEEERNNYRGVVAFLEERDGRVLLKFDDVTTADHSNWVKAFGYTAIPLPAGGDVDPNLIPANELETIGFAIVARLAAARRVP
jgi:hypothetical protein